MLEHFSQKAMVRRLLIFKNYLRYLAGEHVEYVPTLDFHQRHNKPTFWLSHVWLPWADGPIARLLTGRSFMGRLICLFLIFVLGWSP